MASGSTKKRGRGRGGSGEVKGRTYASGRRFGNQLLINRAARRAIGVPQHAVAERWLH